MLKACDFVIAEVSVSKRFKGSGSLTGFLVSMESRGFEVCDVLDGMRAPSGEVMYLDLLFRPIPTAT